MNAYKYQIKEFYAIPVAVMQAEGVLIETAADALDLLASVRYESGCEAIVVRRDMIAPAFYDLRTGVAGEILQKMSNYNMRFGIVGDFSDVTSKALRDFIYESNQTRRVVFLPTEDEAIRALAGASS